MRLEDYQVKLLQSFLGHYDSGTVDTVPEQFFSDTKNIDYDKGEVRTRGGLTAAITLGYGAGNGKVRRFASFRDVNFGPVVLILDDSGNLYTYSSRTGDDATTPRLTVAGATDFSMIKMFNRVYITFHDGYQGISGSNLKVYIPDAVIGNDEFRDAAGLAPSAAGAIGAADGAAGIVNAGTYKIAVAYVTTSGHITVPGPEVASVFTPTTYVSPGSVKIDLTNIPTGPTGTAQRQIIITKVDLEEYYFLPSLFGGVINDNVGTSTTLDFDDTTDLVDSADYLFDQLEAIPSSIGLQDYNGRLLTFGENGNTTIVRASDKSSVEAFDTIDGIININKDDGFSLRNGNVIRDVFYAWKELGLYTVIDNGLEPSEWPVNLIDQSVSAGIHGISEFFDSAGTKTSRDWTLIADRSGLLLFDGIIRKPAITNNIDDIWETINFDELRKIVVAVDERRNKIYCALPTGVSTENNLLLMGDYEESPYQTPNTQGVKWSIWEFNPGGTTKNPTEIGLFSIGADTTPTLKLGSADGGGKVWKLDPTVTDDDGTDIESYIETPLLFWISGAIHYFTAARLRVIGTGTLLCTIRGEDDVLPANLPSITLNPAPGQEMLIRFNFKNEKARIKFRLTSGNFTINKIEVFGKPMFAMRPA